MGVLALRNVAYTYEGAKKTVFKDVSLTFEEGKVYAIVGKSGAGKSTLLSLMAGLDIATEGLVEYDGKDLSTINLNHYRARQAGIVFQSLNLLTNATAIDNLVLSMHISGAAVRDKRARAYAMLEKVGIDKDKAGRKILKLSGGEQQRVAIARALAHDPALIIADEPTGNLDRATVDGILKIFSQLAHDPPESGGGKCVIIVTHSRLITSIADEIWGLDKGAFRQLPARKGK
ncbi:MAG: ABC transporter ATP-binding protein [Oscillospiraceae bacterium]|nr:ABC transporter ATP-binding protein [Oscillospiraceae bacterium]